jgi:DNA polymerase III epsilon subunit-like protein
MKSFLFFDLETGGLHAQRDAITQLGITYCTILDGEPHFAGATDYCWNVKPFEGSVIGIKAAEIQGSTPDGLRERYGITETDLIERLDVYLNLFDPETPVYAWNAAFDTSFMHEMIMRHKGPIDRVGKLHGRLVRCARQLGLIAKDLGYIDSPAAGFSLKTAADHFGLVQQEPHDALADAITGSIVLTRIIQKIQGLS